MVDHIMDRRTACFQSHFFLSFAFQKHGTSLHQLLTLAFEKLTYITIPKKEHKDGWSFPFKPFFAAQISRCFNKAPFRSPVAFQNPLGGTPPGPEVPGQEAQALMVLVTLTMSTLEPRQRWRLPTDPTQG